MAERLKRWVAAAEPGTKSATMLLFGIIFADELSGGSGAVALAANERTETIDYGRSLAPYVEAVGINDRLGPASTGLSTSG